MHDKSITIHLLDYYSSLAAHHRTMMVGFAAFYIGINQALLLTPLQTLQVSGGKNPLALVLSAAFLTTFVLAATMHHACHFCAASGVKAVMAADMHYQHLPQDAAQMDVFVSWMTTTASAARQSLAIRNFSVYILGSLFIALTVVNAYIFVSSAKILLGAADFDGIAFFVSFFVLQAVALISYGVTFAKHFRHFQIAKSELSLVLESDTRAEVNSRIKKNRVPASLASEKAGGYSS